MRYQHDQLPHIDPAGVEFDPDQDYPIWREFSYDVEKKQTRVISNTKRLKGRCDVVANGRRAFVLQGDWVIDTDPFRQWNLRVTSRPGPKATKALERMINDPDLGPVDLRLYRGGRLYVEAFKCWLIGTEWRENGAKIDWAIGSLTLA